MRSRLRTRNVRSLLGIATLGVLVGCNALLGTDESESEKTPVTPDAPAEDAGIEAATETKPPAELGPPPADDTCKSLWTDTKTSDCKNRRTMPLRAGIHSPGGLAIERTASGRIVVAYPRVDGDPAHEVVDVMQFTDPKKPSTSSIGTGMTQYGPIALARWGVDGTLLATHSVMGAAVTVTELDQDGPARPTETVASDIAGASYVDVATNNDSAYVAYFDSTSRKLFLRGKQGSTGKWSTPTAADSEFVTDGLAGSGQVSLQVDDNGSAHVAYHKAVYRTASDFGYRMRTADAWTSGPLTIEPGGIAGFSIALALYGNAHYAAYFASESSGAKPGLRFTKWGATANDGKATEILIPNIIVDDPLKPYTRVAIAVDPWGLVHLAIAVPSGFDIDIRYERQTVVAGEKVWLSDTVASIPYTKEMSEPLVAIAVDDQARPHIAYHSPADDTVYYATDDK